LSVEAEKEEFRRAAKLARKQAAADAGPDAADRLAGNLRQLIGDPAPGLVVSGYLAIGDEIDVSQMLAELHGQGVVCVLPVVVGQDQPLVFRRWYPDVDLQAGPLGTRHPGPENEQTKPDILLVPLLAFDGQGNRIGWGGGFYDRTIGALRADGNVLAVGVAFGGQRADTVPHDSYDARLDWIVTEQGAEAFARDG